MHLHNLYVHASDFGSWCTDVNIWDTNSVSPNLSDDEHIVPNESRANVEKTDSHWPGSHSVLTQIATNKKKEYTSFLKIKQRNLNF